MAVPQPEVAVAAGSIGFERDPGFHGAVGSGGVLGEGPVGRLHVVQRGLEQLPDVRLAFQRLLALAHLPVR